MNGRKVGAEIAAWSTRGCPSPPADPPPADPTRQGRIRSLEWEIAAGEEALRGPGGSWFAKALARELAARRRELAELAGGRP